MATITDRAQRMLSYRTPVTTRPAAIAPPPSRVPIGPRPMAAPLPSPRPPMPAASGGLAGMMSRMPAPGGMTAAPDVLAGVKPLASPLAMGRPMPPPAVVPNRLPYMQPGFWAPAGTGIAGGGGGGPAGAAPPALSGFGSNVPPRMRPPGVPGAPAPGGGLAPAQLPPGTPGAGTYQFDPNNPFSAPDPTKPLENYQQFLGWLTRQYGAGGGFNPMGDPRITQMLRQQVISDAGARSHAAQLGLAGRPEVDPSQVGYLSSLGDLTGSSDLSNQLSNAQLQQALSYQNWIRNMFGMGFQGDVGMGENLANIAAQDRNQPSQWGQFLSGIGGLGAAFLGRHH